MPRPGLRLEPQELAEQLHQLLLSMRAREPIQLTREGLPHLLAAQIFEAADAPDEWRFAMNANEFWTPEETLEISELLWGYIQAGILQPHTSHWSNQNQNVWAQVYITDEGQKRLTGRYPIPEFASQYMSKLGEIAPRLNDRELFYVEEALLAFRAKLFPSALVMLGCSAESLVERLAAAARAEMPQETLRKYDKELEGNITRVWRASWKQLEPQLKQLFPQKHISIQLSLSALYLVIKQARDEAGHPQLVRATIEEVRSALATFPESARAASELLTHLQQ
jgi:hypothetical protein